MLLESTRVILTKHAYEQWRDRVGKPADVLLEAVRKSNRPHKKDRAKFARWLCKNAPASHLHQGRFALINRGQNAIFLVDPKKKVGYFVVITVARLDHVLAAVHDIPVFTPAGTAPAGAGRPR